MRARGRRRRPGRAELKRAIAEAAEHLSLYQLTIEQDTPFAALHAAGKLVIPDEDHARALYDVDAGDLRRARACPPTKFPTTRGRARSAGTISSIGATHEYAGIGPGAHGRLDIDGERHAIATEKRPEAWLMRVEALRHGVVTDEVLTRGEAGRRIPADGIAARRRHRSAALRRASPAARSIRARIAILRDEGAVETTADGLLRVTQAGFPVLDAVVADLAA